MSLRLNILKEYMMKSHAMGTVFLILPLLLTSCQEETKPASQTPREDMTFIAVLPFESISSNPEDAYLADGLHEEILSRLARTPDLAVISRSSVQHYKDVSKTVTDIGSELGVRYILEGNVRVSGDRLRVMVQMIDAETDRHIWAESFDREMAAAKLFEIQQEVAAKVAETVGVIVGGEG